MTSKILVIAEHADGKLSAAVSKTVSAASKIGCEVHVAVFAVDGAAVAGQAAQIAGVTKVLTVNNAANNHALVAIRSARLVPDGRILQLHQPLAVEVTVEVDQAAANAVVGLAFADAERRLLWAAYSDEAGVRLAAGSHTLRIDVPDVTALPGPCLIQVLGFERSAPLVESSILIDVTVEAEGLSHDWEHGLVHTPTHWNLVRDAR